MIDRLSTRHPDTLTPRRRCWWLEVRDQIVAALQRLGFVVGTMQMLTAPSRRSGVLRSHAVPVLTIGGRRYVVADRDDAEWVGDVRAAGRGILRRGRAEETVALIEVPPSERAAILREVPRLVPGGVPCFTRRYGVTADADAFAGLAPQCPVFRIERS